MILPVYFLHLGDMFAKVKNLLERPNVVRDEAGEQSPPKQRPGKMSIGTLVMPAFGNSMTLVGKTRRPGKMSIWTLVMLCLGQLHDSIRLLEIIHWLQRQCYAKAFEIYLFVWHEQGTAQQVHR